MTENELDEQASQLTQLLRGNEVLECIRNEEGEILVKFTNGMRLFINSDKPLDLSVT
ncbi:hypothetical protein [Shewanella canadensis]|uniref:hypothetical protein n=1 Tax=Shewanella canadensis TaxID=271096 RepID=UPI00163B1B6C|nr:hypothetical protein [Shewanella canadensis]